MTRQEMIDEAVRAVMQKDLWRHPAWRDDPSALAFHIFQPVCEMYRHIRQREFQTLFEWPTVR